MCEHSLSKESERVIIKLLNIYQEKCLTSKNNDSKEFIFSGLVFKILNEDYLCLCKIIDCIKGVI